MTSSTRLEPGETAPHYIAVARIARRSLPTFHHVAREMSAL